MNLHDFRESMEKATSKPLEDSREIPGLPADPNEARDFLRRLDREMCERVGQSWSEVVKEGGHRFAQGLTDGSHHD